MSKRGESRKKTKPKRQNFCPVDIYRISSPKSYATYPYLSYSPSEAGAFVTDQQRNVIKCDDSSLFPSFISDLPLPLDLNVGYTEYIKDKASEQGQDDNRLPLWQRFLKWITLSNFDVRSVDFVARRGILKFMGYTLYNRFKNPWSFRACKYNGVVYIHEPDPDIRSKAFTVDNERCKRFMYWGKKFEDYATLSHDNVAGCYSMVHGNIGKYKVLLGSEIDAVRLKHSSTGSALKPEYLEIKTCVQKKIRDKISFGWLQSYLAGIPTLAFGFRDNDGMVGSVAEYPVSAIPHQFTNWNPCSIFGMISSVLNWVYQHLEEGSSGTLVYDGSNEIMLTHESGHFLPEWYLKHLQR